MKKLQAILAHLPEDFGITFIPDFDDAILGIELISMRLVYSKSKMLDICVDELGLNDQEAIPFIEDSMFSYRSTQGLVDITPVVMDDISSFMY
jgi:hypothetical protein